MKRFLFLLSAFSFIGVIGRHPAIAGTLLLMSVGGVGVVYFTPPTPTPQTSAYFDANQAVPGSTVNNALKPNQGSVGAFELPSTITQSHWVYLEGSVDQSIGYSSTYSEYALGPSLLHIGPWEYGSPSFYVGLQISGSGYWWTPTGVNVGGVSGPISVSGGTGYNNGIYPFIATGGGCLREPTGLLNIGETTSGVPYSAQIVDPGLQCATTPTVTPGNIASIGSQQTATFASCAANSPVSGEFTVKATVPITHGVPPGQTFNLSGFSVSGYNVTYSALAGTSGTTLVGEASGTSCPSGSPTTGTFAPGSSSSNGSGLAITLTAWPTGNIYASNDVTGIQVNGGQHFCGVIGEFGSDSAYPGLQFAAFTDQNGNALPGSPAVSTWTNQGLAVFNGTTTTSSTTLTINSMTQTTATIATWSDGQATFTATSNPYPIGTTLVTSGFTPSGYNTTAQVIARTATTVTIAMATNPGTVSIEGTFTGTVEPGMIIGGTGVTSAFILPYGSGSTTGTGGAGTYLLSSSQTTGQPAETMSAANEFYYSNTSSPPTVRTQAAIGDIVQEIGSKSTTTNTNENGWGGQIGTVGMFYGIFPNINGAPNNSALSSLCTKSQDFHAWATTNSQTVHSLYRLNDPGLWADSGGATVMGYVSGTTLTVTSTLDGAVATGLYVSAPGVTGCPTACPSISSGSGPYTLSASGGTVGSSSSPVQIALGTYRAAAPLASATLTGYTSGSTLTVSALSAGVIMPGQWLLNPGIATPVEILSGSGSTWTLSNSTNGAIGSSGSPASFTTTGITAGGPVTPGPALTIADNGPGTTFPVTSYQAPYYGMLKLSGTYSASALGGTPSAIQAQVSATPNGPALSGCSPTCAWTNLSSASIGGGNWSGNLPGVPGGGPYYLAVRAANGTAYANLASFINVGIVVGWQGQSQMGVFWTGSYAGNSINTVTGEIATAGWQNSVQLSNLGTFWTSGPVAGAGQWQQNFPSQQPINQFGQRGTVSGPLADGAMQFAQTLETVSGLPVELVQLSRGGTGSDYWLNGYTPQTQSIGTGDGTSTTWCSAVIYCANDAAGALTYNAAYLTSGALPNYLWGVYALGGGGTVGGAAPEILAGTFQIKVNGSVVCTDSNSPAYNLYSGNCAGAGISSSFINYMTGAFSIQFSTPPAPGASITASWTNILDILTTGGPAQTDWMGNGQAASGNLSQAMSKVPGGLSVMMQGQCSNNDQVFTQSNGYWAGMLSQSSVWSYVDGIKYPTYFPQISANYPVMSVGHFREVRTAGASQGYLGWIADCAQWSRDFGEQSSFSATISGSTLTLTSAVTGLLWEGEVISGAGVATGTQVKALLSGTWGASGSTYSLTKSSAVASAVAMANAGLYSGAGPAGFGGPDYDSAVVPGSGNNLALVNDNPHGWSGEFGLRRPARRFAAALWAFLSSQPTYAAFPTLNHNTIGACDSSATASPCFDIGTTYGASASATFSGTTMTVTGGLTAGSRPFVPGMVLTGSGFTTIPVILSVSAPATGSPSGSQIGSTFTATLSANPGVAGPVTATGGCSGTAGTGSNCVDVNFSILTTGTYGTAASLATCGANNINGTASGYTSTGAPNGTCADNGLGEYVKGFRIGTQQSPVGGTNGAAQSGGYYEDGFDPAASAGAGVWTQSAAFTCNLVAATVVQCVKGPNGSSVGQWASGSTFIAYGDHWMASGRWGLQVGPAGGSSLPFTAGSGYTNGTYTLASASCAPVSGGSEPSISVTVSAGVITNVYPKTPGYGCTAAASYTITGMGSGSGGALTTVPLLTNSVADGSAGIATINSDQNGLGDFLYDNSGISGNPLNAVFTNASAGYWEPGMPVLPFGDVIMPSVSG